METFVVQIWSPVDDAEGERDDLRGFVEHVGSGRRESFRGARDLLSFVTSQLENTTCSLGDLSTRSEEV